jgi:hypothetical protein
LSAVIGGDPSSPRSRSRLPCLPHSRVDRLRRGRQPPLLCAPTSRQVPPQPAGAQALPIDDALRLSKESPPRSITLIVRAWSTRDIKPEHPPAGQQCLVADFGALAVQQAGGSRDADRHVARHAGLHVTPSRRWASATSAREAMSTHSAP